MFLFGDPADAAKMQLDMYLNGTGPGVPDVHFDEMKEQDLRNVMAYIYAALDRGIQQGLDEAMLDVLREWYDEVFYALAEASEEFRQAVLGGLVFFPDGPSVRKKYIDLVMQASES